MVDPEKNSWSIQAEIPRSVQEKFHGWSRKNVLVDPEKMQLSMQIFFQFFKGLKFL